MAYWRLTPFASAKAVLANWFGNAPGAEPRGGEADANAAHALPYNFDEENRKSAAEYQARAKKERDDQLAAGVVPCQYCVYVKRSFGENDWCCQCRLKNKTFYCHIDGCYEHRWRTLVCESCISANSNKLVSCDDVFRVASFGQHTKSAANKL